VPIVSRLSITPVKGLALSHPADVLVGPLGVAENRRFYLIDEDGRRYGLLRDGRLALVTASYSDERLALAFPDGATVEGEVRLGEAVATDFYGSDRDGHLVEGPWSEALSSYVGRPLRLARADAESGAIDRARGTVSLLSQASLDELGRRSGRPAVDHRRFRMLFHVDGLGPHEEDEWIGRDVRVGAALIRVHDRVARCAITTQNPETGRADFDTLREIRAYRGAGENGKDIDFGVFGEVVEPGAVRVGDPVEPR
jgi:uncharacterized protein YcbX